MAFYLSPGVNVVEKDLTSIVPAVSTSTGAFAGVFQWGPVLDPVTVNSENVLVQRFGKPNDSTAQSFFTAANFLSYSNNLIVTRAAVAGAKNAVVNTTGSLLSATVSNPGSGFTNIPVVTVNAGTGTATATLKVVTATISSGQAGADYSINDLVTVNIGSGAEAVFKVTTVGALGAVTGIEITSGGNYNNIAAASLSNVVTGTADGGTGLKLDLALGLNTVTVSGGNYTTAPNLTVPTPVGGTAASITNVTIASTGVTINNGQAYLDSVYDTGGGSIGEFIAKYPGALGNSIGVSIADADSFVGWEVELPNGNLISFDGEFDSAPGTSSYVSAADGSNDELHVVVYDTLGAWTGIPGTILEKYAFVSKASDARKSDLGNNYYKDVINTDSSYVWWADHDAEGTNWGTPAAGKNFETLTVAKDYQLAGGIDALSASDAELTTAFGLFANDELYDISLIPVGKASATVAEYVINSVAEARKDCLAFISPEDISNGEVIVGSGDTATGKLNAYRDELPSTPYAVLDSGYKYQYDRYNDKYRYIPLNGDIAGLCARTDNTNDPWWSPGGLNRGQIKNVVRLAVNPTKTDRDTLYKNGVNPVVSFPGQGVVLFGDKTLLSRPSAFDRINVRRLFIVLEKAIATAAKFQLFEFNDAFTRAQFKALVEPFLRDVQGRRGVIDFRVKCDETNNTGVVIDRNEFVADIFIKPNRSINFITLNFIAARSSVSFEEIGA